MNSQIFNKGFSYPESWGEDDKLRFDRYLIESKKLYPKMPESLLQVAVSHQIFEELGLIKPLDYNKIEKYEITSAPFDVIKSDNETIEITA